MALAFLWLVSLSRENVFRKRLVAMEALLSTTSVLEGWKTFNHFESPDLLNIPKFIIIRMRKRRDPQGDFQKQCSPLPANGCVTQSLEPA